jgi:hypothetical protein
MRLRWRLWIAIVAILASGCVRAGSGPESSLAPSASPETAETAIAEATPSPAPTDEPLPSDLDPKVAHAIEMRRGSGLRHDLLFVLASMADPRATSNLLDFPLYPEEEASLMANQADQDLAVSVIQAYAMGHTDEFGGIYIDRDKHPGVVTALWTDHLEDHQRAINDKLDGGFVILRQVRYAETDLRDLQHTVSVATQGAWFDRIPAKVFSIGVSISGNVAVLRISSSNPDAPRIVAQHLNADDRLRVESDDTGAMLIPDGTVKGRVIRPDGRRLGENDLMLDDESTTPGGCGGGDMGFGIRNDGTFEYPCQAGLRTIVVRQNIAEGEWKVIGRGTIKVLAHKTVKLTIELTENP